jgi:hypothetical protein
MSGQTAAAASADHAPKQQKDANDLLHGLTDCKLISQQGKAVRTLLSTA